MLGVGPFGPLGPRGVALEAGMSPAVSSGASVGESGGESVGESGGEDDRRPLDDERLAWAVLASIVELEPPVFMDLVREHGTARRVLEAALHGSAAVPATGPIGLASLLADAARRERAVAGDIARLGLTVMIADDDTYPSRLRAIDLAPPVLFVLGEPAALDADRSVAVVGTRRPTET